MSAQPALTDEQLAAAIAGQLNFDQSALKPIQTPAPRTGTAWPVLIILLALLG